MATAGYSGTPLPKKLGIKPGHVVALIAAPRGYERLLAPLPEGVTLLRRARRNDIDVVQFFTTRRVELARRFGPLAHKLASNGGLWISWPKRSSGVATDVDEGVVREIGLASGLVDNKICAVDETWSGLRFVIRVANRR